MAGRFEFERVPAGQYEVTVEMPHGFPPASSDRWVPGVFDDSPRLTRGITISNDRACSYAPFSAVVDGRISGRVLKSDGSPAKYIEVEAVAADINTRGGEHYLRLDAMTNESGRFEFRRLPAGSYHVGVNLRDVVTRFKPYPRALQRRDR